MGGKCKQRWNSEEYVLDTLRLVLLADDKGLVLRFGGIVKDLQL